MIEKLEELDPCATIAAKVIVTKVGDDYLQYLELNIPPDIESNELITLMDELSQALNDSKFRLDRIIDGI